jgi:hypothetical protein
VAGIAVKGDVNGHTFAPQAARDRLGQGLFVFDYQNPHPSTVP